MNTVLITGCYGNLGQAVTKKFIEDGYKVIGTVAPNEPPIPELKAPDFETAIIDLSHEEKTLFFIKDIIQKHQRIDAAVLTVGGFAMGKIEETNDADLDKMISLNFLTAYHIARPLFSHMLEQGSGRLVFIGAKPALDAKNSRGMFAYGLSKAMVIRLAEIINLEAEGKGVSSTVVIPSTIDTPQNRASMPDADWSKWLKAEDIAEKIAGFCKEGGKGVIDL